MKKYISLILAALLALVSLTGCSTGNANGAGAFRAALRPAGSFRGRGFTGTGGGNEKSESRECRQVPLPVEHVP